MKRLFVLSFVLLAAIAAVSAGEPAVSVTEVREVGISSADETKSVIEVRWRSVQPVKRSIEAIRIQLSVTYADGSTIVLTRLADPASDRATFDVPSTRNSRRLPPAFIKKLNAIGVAVFQKGRR